MLRSNGSTAERLDLGPFVWLLGQTSYDFDPFRYDDLGCTPLIRLSLRSVASCADIDALLCAGANIDARVRPTARGLGFVNLGFTALYEALSRLSDIPEGTLSNRIERIKRLIRRGANIHAVTDGGYTPTDVVVGKRDRALFGFWRGILQESDYDLKPFIRKKITVHAAIPWWVDGWSDYVLEALCNLDEDPDWEKDHENSHLFLAREARWNLRQMARQESEDDSDDSGPFSADNEGSDGDSVVDDGPFRDPEEVRAEMRVDMRRRDLLRYWQPRSRPVPSWQKHSLHSILQITLWYLQTKYQYLQYSSGRSL